MQNSAVYRGLIIRKEIFSPLLYVLTKTEYEKL